MFSAYGGEDFSLALNFGNVTNVDSDIIVVFAGVNDYLADVSNKRFGNAKDVLSTAGYCGSVRYFMKQLKEGLQKMTLLQLTGKAARECLIMVR